MKYFVRIEFGKWFGHFLQMSPDMGANTWN